MLARFFINRPIFAWVIAIVIMLGGLVAIRTLPVAQYPDVAPPMVSISATYTGASAETVESSVTQVLEQQLTGIDGLLYFSSSSSSAGTVSIGITFEQGTDPDTAQVQVQNKVQQALARLPQSVQQQGVTVTKSLSDFLMVVTLYDATDKSTGSDTADYLVSNFQDPLARVSGVGNVQVFGAQYAMRIWLDPVKLAAYDLMPSDVSAAVEAQNTQVSAGKIGGLPASSTQELNATVTAQSRLQTAEQFRNIILKYDSSGATLRLGDVARVELGSETYDVITRANGHPASGMALQLAPGANALQTSQRVRAAIAELSRSLPAGYHVLYAKDSTPFIRASISEVVKTLAEAIVLVVIVMFVFLQNWRATLIPAIAVPVVMLGTFGVLEVFGYSINTLTLFGLVLAIGLLVDDAIVVVENVERVMREEKLSPKEATVRSMQEITGALIGIAAVLSAVFLPMAFFSGSTGVIYRQFAVTIVASMALSVFVAITLTPALCATLLKEKREARGVFARFNSSFERLTERYVGGVAGVNRRPLRFVILYAVLLGALGWLFMRLPTGFLPDEDQGEIMVQFILPTGASAARTEAVAKQVENYFLQQEGANVDTLFSICGFNFSGSGQNSGLAFIALKDWSQRPGSDNGSAAIVQRATKALSSVRDARVLILNPPSVQGLGQTGGFESQVLAAGGTDRAALQKIRDEILSRAIKDPKLMAVRLGSQDDAPQLHLQIDTAKANSLGVASADINDTLSAAWGGTYINDFVDRSRVKKVFMQGDEQYRSSPDDLNQWYVRNSGGGMTPFAAFARSGWTYGPENLPRFNGVASYSIQGSAAPGVSSGAAMSEMEKLVKATGNGTSLAWSGLSYQERLSGGQAMSLYAVSILVVFLCLAALYESWSIPLSVLLVIPLGVIGCVAAISLRGLQNDVYFQVALLTTIGLAAKNAILIIEFAEASYRRGTDLVSAALEAARQRLRPVLMTSLAFIAGVAPLAVATGAGANSRIAIGTGIIGGTATATVLALFLVPLFFVLVSRVFGNPAQAEIEAEAQHV
jgi:multidrug efflux pump